MFNFRKLVFHGALATAFVVQPSFAQSLVKDDLITGSKETTPWVICDSDAPADVTTLDAGLCAYRTTPVQAGVTYRMSCGVTVAKFASITLAYLDANDQTLSKDSTEVTEHVSGAYSVTLAAPAGTVNAAIGIYGEPGSGFQDCVLLDATPPPEPTKGSISGVAWFDANGDSVLDPNESFITGTNITLVVGGVSFDQVQTDNKGAYYIGGLSTNTCYTINFAPADGTLQLGATGGDNDALASGMTNEVCLTEAVPDVTNIDAAFIAIPPVKPPADYAVCGVAWVDGNSNGTFDGTDMTLPHVYAALFDDEGIQVDTTTTDGNGNYSFYKLTDGGYTVRFTTPDGHEPTTASGQPLGGSSYIDSLGSTPSFNLPASSNTEADSACTIQNVNAGYIKLPVALAPTVAEDDMVMFDVGVDFGIDFLANDMPCEGSAVEIDLLGHNVPGSVSLNGQQLSVTGTTAFGQYSIEYGIRGACGSYDMATILVGLKEVIPPVPPSAPDAPVCRVETGGDTVIGGVDLFNADEYGFAPTYNFYDRDRKLVTTVDSSDYSHRVFIGANTRWGQTHWGKPYADNWEMEWTGSQYGFDQLSVHYVAAVENGVESELTQCDRLKISPIALDLDNNGRIQRLSGDYSVDVDGDGIKEPLRQWFAPSAGILVTADATGEITGDQMFGNVPGIYADGFEELATLDNNGDKKLTGKELATLAIWTDLNSNAVVDAEEITSLADHQIVALALNHHKYMARATKANGKSILMEDVWLPLAPLAAR